MTTNNKLKGSMKSKIIQFTLLTTSVALFYFAEFNGVDKAENALAIILIIVFSFSCLFLTAVIVMFKTDTFPKDVNIEIFENERKTHNNIINNTYNTFVFFFTIVLGIFGWWLSFAVTALYSISIIVSMSITNHMLEKAKPKDNQEEAKTETTQENNV